MIDFQRALSICKGVRFPSAPPQEGNQQSIEIAGFSFILNGYRRFMLSISLTASNRLEQVH